MGALTAVYVDPAINANSGTGTIGDPYGDLQYALNTVTRDATNGNIFHVKAGTAEVLAASLTLATYGAPAAGVPLIIRGYTTTANDGGKCNIDCNGVAFWASTYQYWLMVDVHAHNFGNNTGIAGTTNGYYGLVACEVDKGASTPSSKMLINCNYGFVIGCYVHDAGTDGTGIYGEIAGHIMFNYVKNCPKGVVGNAIFNVIDGSTAFSINQVYAARIMLGNTIYSSGAPTGSGITTNSVQFSVILSNIIEGFAGSGGEAIYSTTGDIAMIGFNAYYNNTANRNVGDILLDVGGDVSLSASPFTNAAGGDFSLNTAVVGAIDGAFPGAWYGPASTTDHADIGAVQNPAGSGGGGAVRILPLMKVGL